MYTIAICDSDNQAAESLRQTIHNVLDSLNVTHAVYYYRNESLLYKALKAYPEKYNLLFLETGPATGINLASMLRKDGYEYPIVLVSENQQMALEGYEVEAIQYFLKPIEENQLRKLFLRLSVKRQKLSPGHLLLHMGATCYKIPYSNITFVETTGRKVTVHTGKDSIVYPCKLSEIQELLPSDLFIRCHQSFLLQVHAVHHITRLQAFLRDGTVLPISRSYKEEVQRFFCS